MTEPASNLSLTPWMLAVVICLQIAANLTVQRQAYNHLRRGVGSGFLLHIIGGPGTAIHEGAHWLMCKAMGFRVTQVVWYGPKKCEQEGKPGTLGFIRYKYPADKEEMKFFHLRCALVSAAPGILIPPALALFTIIAFRSTDFAHYETVIKSQPWWLLLTWFVVIFLLGRSMFPSTGDKFTLKGVLWLFMIFVVPFILIVLLPFPDAALFTLQVVALLLLPSTISSALWMTLVMKDR